MQANAAGSLGRAVVLAVLVAVALAAGAPGARAFAITDGTFAASSWTFSHFSNPGGGGGGGALTQAASGGNPGTYGASSFSVGPQTSQIWVGYSYTPTTYNPATQGAILDLDMALDVRSNTAGFSFGSRVMIEQGGSFYTASLANAPVLSWGSFSHNDLVPASFALASGSTGPATPDFGQGGGLIRFGFLLQKDGDTSDPVMNWGVDNFSVQLASAPVVPEPGALGLVLAAAAAAAPLARRRAR